MKSQTLRVKLDELKIMPSHSRPRVSNDNAYVKSLFRTVKYEPQWPSTGFKTVEDAYEWVNIFTCWYNSSTITAAYAMSRRRNAIKTMTARY